jgi:UDP-sugar transporter A1/2/3
MVLLALQFAFQPILTKAFASDSKLVKSTYVLLQDAARIAICGSLLWGTHGWKSAVAGYQFSTALRAAGFPALLYAIQNYCSLTAYQNLSPIAYNVLNQTKTLSAAIWCYILLGLTQSYIQTLALFILLLSALTMESIVPLPYFMKRSKKQGSQPTHPADSMSERAEASNSSTATGVTCVLIASMTSGLAGAWTQRFLQSQSRNSLLFSVELAACSMLFLMTSLLVGTRDGQLVRQNGFFAGWSLYTCIPLLTNSFGGVLVGLVTKYAGSVPKGFALIIGMFLSGK